VNVRSSRNPSTFAEALAQHIASSHHVGTDVHWGNDGFSVDVALHHPSRAEDVTVGVLCDGSRFSAAEDPVEWDVFRTAVHEGQGWRLHRLWSPHYFRDPAGCVRAILKDAAAVAADEREADDVRAFDR
jgi:hypothetical protein